MPVEKRWVIKDGIGNILNEFEGVANEDFIGQEFNGVLIASVEQIADVELPDSNSSEFLWAALRKERNKILALSDWTQVADAPVDQAAWAAYRQALRDLPANTTDPANPVWPSKPS